GESLGRDFVKFRKELDLSGRLAASNSARDEFEDRLESLRDMISEFSVRETKDSGIITLPRKTIRSVFTDWEPRQLELYHSIRDEMRAVVVREGLPTEDESESILKRMLRLVQVASNPKLIDQSYSAQPGKFEPLQELVQNIRRNDEKCIVWTTFTDNVEWLAFELAPFGTEKVHGKLPMERRTKAIDRFMTDPKRGVLVATPGAAKEGLTLTVANHAIFFDRSFSLDDYLQAQDRIHRISQQRRCEVVNLLMSDSIDEWVDVLLHAKRLAAQLAQGDISREYYSNQMEYGFAEMLRDILNIRREDRETR
ncbi:MAG TPA: helicase-related protein, partial [bacterium]|nr:helicase-related protein [bacterium]